MNPRDLMSTALFHHSIRPRNVTTGNTIVLAHIVPMFHLNYLQNQSHLAVVYQTKSTKQMHLTEFHLLTD